MKRIHLIPVLLLFFVISAQKCNEIQKTITVTQKYDPKQKGTQLVLDKVENDSRCPIGTQCVWAGEVTVHLKLYKNGKVTDEKKMVESDKYHEENQAWLSTIFPKKVKNYSVLPYPDQKKPHTQEDYNIFIEFEDKE
jgi:hypothetical protein